MPGEAVILGPFVGGLNNVNDAAYLADDELRECRNLEVDVDGSLVSRPPITEITGPNTPAAGRARAVGSAIFGTEAYVAFGTTQSSTNGAYVLNDNLTSWTSIAASLACEVALQYGGFLWFVPAFGETTDGGRWDGTTFTADADIPSANGAVIWKDRMWVWEAPDNGVAGTNPSRLTFSAEADPGSWPAANFIDVNPGDGQQIETCIVYQDSLLIFKSDSTYVLAFELNPADAILRKINTVVGAGSRRAVAEYENSVYVIHGTNVYEVVNFDFVRISDRVDLERNTTATENPISVFLSVIGDRLIVGYGHNRFCYTLLTRSWSTWSSESSVLSRFGPMVAMPKTPMFHDAAPTTYVGGLEDSSSTADPMQVFKILSEIDSSAVEDTLSASPINIVCIARTKYYDFGEPYSWKRLFWWGADLVSEDDVTAQAIPYQGTTVTEVVSAADTDPENRFYKFEKALRFRMLSFSIETTYGGSTGTGPVRLWTFSAFLRGKQTVSKESQN